MAQILAVKSTTYFLGEVPQLHSLVENMTSQQLAHFSRVLALLVFEPEYRQLMESAHVLRYAHGKERGGAGGGMGSQWVYLSQYVGMLVCASLPPPSPSSP